MARGPSLRLKIIAGVASVVLLASGFLVYQLIDTNPASFRRGGEFAGAATPDSTTTSTGSEAATSSSLGSPGTAPQTTTPGPTASSAPSTTARVTSTIRAGAQTSGTSASTAPPSTQPPTTAATPPRTQPDGPALPAFGTYTYAVDGQEAVTGFGSRPYPATMTTVVHGGAGVQADQAVFDLTYSSNHQEREIVGFRADGIYFDFEGGSVTFGPRTETSQADYDPPMLQIPKPLQGGLTPRSGTSKALGADGSITRIEDWKVTVVGQETVVVAGASVATWKVQVDRTFRPGYADQGMRKRTYWFDPARNVWVKYVEVFHGVRNTVGFDFTYDSNLTATLTGFTP